MEVSGHLYTPAALSPGKEPLVPITPNVNFHIHKRPPLVPILSQKSAVHTFTSYFFKLQLNGYSYVHLRPPYVLFPSYFPAKVLYAFLISPI
jgi:hypothetical protein